MESEGVSDVYGVVWEKNRSIRVSSVADIVLGNHAGRSVGGLLLINTALTPVLKSGLASYWIQEVKTQI